MIRRCSALGLAVWLAGSNPQVCASDQQFSGFIKARYQHATFPERSAIAEQGYADTTDFGTEWRGVWRWQAGPGWSFAGDVQLIGVQSDTLALSESVSDPRFSFASPLPSDDARYWDMTTTLASGDGDKHAVIGRLDRLWAAYRHGNVSLKLGRQALSWGSGLIFTPLDLFSPFNPLQVDRDYKPGDDMLTGQWQLGDDDLQWAAVARRDADSGQSSQDQNTLALKYHAIVGNTELDALAAQHYGEPMLGFGITTEWASIIWRGEGTVTEVGRERISTAVLGMTWSTSMGQRPVTVAAEYYYSGYGQAANNYGRTRLLLNPPLSDRLVRGELFTLARRYAAVSAWAEINPRWSLTPVLIANLDDSSGVAQISSRYDVTESLVVLGSVTAPIGSFGSEYGGFEYRRVVRNVVIADSGPAAFIQLAWYY
ncbi:MAG: hypothetical protein DHS20C11_13050 [Lysobacteraceae bacterium]|nr:MAG: hypothetical protein DHS20C11_13050 [Xanthomonadaceae bacterium]